MAEKLSNTEKLYKKYLAKMSGVLASEEANNILSDIRNGKNAYMRIDKVESSAFDDSWIKVVEDVIFDLGDIIANPRQNTKIVTELVPVELARKTNAESTRHLASHTQFIKDIAPNGDVIPSKILNIGHDDDLHTYENRFIATFVRKLVLFIEKRYEYALNYANLHDQEYLLIKNHTFIGKSEVEIETKVRVTTPKEDEHGVEGSEYLERIKKIRDYVLYFHNSSFMRQLKTDKDVRNPILQTNIIRKNIKYHHCFEVYKFLDKYDSLGVNYKVDENFSIFSEQEIEELNYASLINFLSLKAKHVSDEHKTTSKSYKPKILTSSDDEKFVYGPLYTGPISFLRIDDDYQTYLDSKLNKELPIHPSKKDRENYSEDYQYKADNKEAIEQREKFIKRKLKETNAFNKYAENIVKQREEQARIAREMEEARLKAEEERRLNEIREALKQEAINAHGEGSSVSEEAKNYDYVVPEELPLNQERQARRLAKYTKENGKVDFENMGEEQPIVEEATPHVLGNPIVINGVDDLGSDFAGGRDDIKNENKDKIILKKTKN